MIYCIICIFLSNHFLKVETIDNIKNIYDQAHSKIVFICYKWLFPKITTLGLKTTILASNMVLTPWQIVNCLQYHSVYMQSKDNYCCVSSNVCSTCDYLKWISRRFKPMYLMSMRKQGLAITVKQTTSWFQKKVLAVKWF